MKAIFVSNTAAYLLNMWLPLARALREQGADVILAAPVGPEANALVADGFRFESVPILRGVGLPWAEFKALTAIVRLYRRENPDVVHHFTAKPIVYGSLAAKLTGVPRRVSTISGLGYVFAKTSLLARAWQRLVLRLYRFVLRGRNSWIIFQNPDDRDLFLRRGVASTDRTAVVLGSGVDTRAFPASPLPKGIPVVLCAARLLWDKGIGEYVAAARVLRRKGVSARFLLAGWRDSEHPGAIPESVIRGWHDEGVIEYVGHCKDMVGLLKESTIVVLASKYREGVPRVLVEAASMARPLIATDVPGCREVCIDGVTGTLVHAGDTAGLASAIADMLANPTAAAQLGRNGRILVEKAFDLRRVVSETIAVYAGSAGALSDSGRAVAVRRSR